MSKDTEITNKITPSLESLINILKQDLEKDEVLKDLITFDQLEETIRFFFDNQHLTKGDEQLTKGFDEIIDKIVEKLYIKEEGKK